MTFWDQLTEELPELQPVDDTILIRMKTPDWSGDGAGVEGELNMDSDCQIQPYIQGSIGLQLVGGSPRHGGLSIDLADDGDITKALRRSAQFRRALDDLDLMLLAEEKRNC